MVTITDGYFGTLAFRYLAVIGYQPYKRISNNADLGNGAEGHDPQPLFFVPPEALPQKSFLLYQPGDGDRHPSL